jgi:Raf kinase inhibitor-like YbhB/YbcL family protein
MKKLLVIFIILVILAVGGFFIYKYSGQTKTTFSEPEANNQTNTTTAMTISSPAFLDGQSIPKQYTCDGDGINPPLEFSGVPAEAKSLALLLEDPDAPGGTWIHWLMWNISPSTNQIAENSVPQEATQGQGSSGQNVYGAPCPPSGIHHYIFTVYALSSELSLPSYSTSTNLQSAMQDHIISQAQLTGLYGR